MGLDVASCCRLCLANAVSQNATHIDLTEQQEVGEIIQELYGLKINGSGRGSKLVCVACYKKTIDLKKHLNGHQTKAKLVSLNQAILKAQVNAFPEPEPEEDVPLKDGYNPPSTANAEMFLLVEDCMRSMRFQDRFTDRYDLLYVRVSGSVYQSGTDDYVDMWFPDEWRCSKCITSFEAREEFDAHHEACRFRCPTCRRFYMYEESMLQHACQKRDKYTKEKRKRLNGYAMVTVGKRFRIDTGDFESAGKESSKELETPAVEKTTDSNELKIVPVTSVVPVPAGAPQIEGEANLDVELSSLLERWYGQNEDLEELSDLNLEAIEPANSNGMITGGTLFTSTVRNETAPPKPAISVKPMSQLMGTPAGQRMAQQAAFGAQRSSDVIEIDDDDDNMSQAVVPASLLPLNKQDQQSLSESDILNIVKHFRGIDENESYLIKAKINGASKLICISKRKGEAGSVPSATIVNNSASVQANGSSNSGITSKPAQLPSAPLMHTVRQPAKPSSPPPLVPTVNNSALSRKPTFRQAPSRAGQSFMKITPSNVNGHPMSVNIPPSVVTHNPQPAKKSGTVVSMPPVPPMPQLKIAHVESLVSPNAIGQQQQQQPRVLNGQMMNPGMQQFNRSNVAIAHKAKGPNVISPGNRAPPSATKAAPRRIIVGSNSIKMLNPPKTMVPRPSQPTAVRSPSKSLVTTTSTQQRIVVQRKQIKTVVQSTVRRTSTGVSAQNVTPPGPSMNTTGNSMLRTQLLQPQQPPRIFPGPSSSDLNSTKVASADQLLSSLAGSNRQFKLNNTTFKRLD